MKRLVCWFVGAIVVCAGLSSDAPWSGAPGARSSPSVARADEKDAKDAPKPPASSKPKDSSKTEKSDNAEQKGTDEGAKAPADDGPNPQERKFSERMANTVLVGRFTIDGQPGDKPAAEERYEIESVTKLRGNYWTFLARIKYGSHDLKVPVTVQLLWAGDTPMVSLTDLTIPGLGTFTSRVIFYEDRYAGTWQHGKVGGHMFGRIEKAKAGEKPGEKTPDKPGEGKPGEAKAEKK